MIIKDYFNGFETIKTYNMTDDIYQKFKEKSDRLEDNRIKTSMFSDKVEVLMSSSSYILGIGMFAICAYMVSISKINYGQMVAVVQLSNSIMSPLMMVFVCFGKLIASFAIWEKINKLFENNVQVHNNNAISFDNALRLDNVSFSYNDNDVFQLKNISFEFKKGKKYAIVGKSGSGKSTLIKLLLKYYPNYTGKISVDNCDYKEIGCEQLYSKIAYIQQDVMIFNDTFMYNITLGKEYDTNVINNALHISGLDNVIKKLENGLETEVGENGCRFSGGEKQRIALCRAILKSAKLIILDEMSNGLDNITAREIEREILKLKGVTLISITHKTDYDLMKFFDEIIVIENGKITNAGKLHELFDNDENFVNLLA